MASVAEAFTQLYERAQRGDGWAASAVYNLALPRLRQIASALIGRHRGHESLHATALVNEFFVKFRGFGPRILGREHFYRISARAMRQVLVDRGRAMKVRQERMAELHQVFGRQPSGIDPEDREAVRQLAGRFRKIDARASRVLWLHYVEGYGWEEIAALMGIPAWRARQDAAFALRWMRDNLS